MNTNGLAKRYGTLTPEERFGLILAAGGRGDEAERDRLVNAGGRITLSMHDHFPYAHAFRELAMLTYIELQDAAGFYHVALSAENEDDEADKPDTATKQKDNPRTKTAARKRSWQRSFELAYAAGYILKAKADGWKLFCERLNVPPLLLWEGFPGLDRLQSALAATEKAAFAPEGMLRWMNVVRPADDPELTEVPLTVEQTASANEKAFRRRAKWWSGDADALNWRDSEK